MTRNKQNIMREVRKAGQNKRKSLEDLLEINFPWFFAEPKYGVAMLFVAFAGLQYLGTNARNAAQSRTGIYTTSDQFAAYEQPATVVTNVIVYPKIPDNFRLFDDARNQSDVMFVERLEEQR
jgi:hypothetical protein